MYNCKQDPDLYSSPVNQDGPVDLPKLHYFMDCTRRPTLWGFSCSGLIKMTLFTTGIKQVGGANHGPQPSCPGGHCIKYEETTQALTLAKTIINTKIQWETNRKSTINNNPTPTASIIQLSDKSPLFDQNGKKNHHTRSKRQPCALHTHFILTSLRRGAAEAFFF